MHVPSRDVADFRVVRYRMKAFFGTLNINRDLFIKNPREIGELFNCPKSKTLMKDVR